MDKRMTSIVWVQFKERKLRSSLTILGIVIGITALVALIILSNGLKAGVTQQLDVFGADEILIAPKASSGQQGHQGYGFMTSSDIETIKSVTQITSVDSILQSTFEVQYGRDKKRLSVSGVGSDRGSDRTAEDYFKMDIIEGRYMENNDRRVANIGYKIAYDTFDKDIFVGTTIRIDGNKYTVIGIFEEQGSRSQDNIIYVPINDLRDSIGDSRAVTAAVAKVSPGADMDIVVERVQQKLKRSRGRDDMGVITPKQLKEQIGSLLGVVDLVVLSIAFISLFVGALGIMNSMYTSVLQRTREIGIMKAVGAKNSQILSLFLIESAMLGFFGGVIGVIVGSLMAFGFITVINSFGFIKLLLVPDYALFTGAIIFSTLLGIASGILPAINASKLKVVDALRYE